MGRLCVTGLIILGCLVLLAGAGFAAGTTGAEFLRLAPTARVASLGEAQVALADEGDGFFYNPAGLARNRQPRLTTSYAFYAEDAAYEYLSYLHPLDAESLVGLSFVGLQSTDMRRDMNGREGGEFTNSDYALGLTYGRQLSQLHQLRVGGTVKYIHRSLDMYVADAWAADFGVQGDITENWFWGASVTNLGGSVKFISEGDPLPRALRAGLGMRALDRKLLLLTDVQRVRGGRTDWLFGAQWQPLENIFIRLGYLNPGEGTVEEGFRAGLGLKHSLGDFDYAYGDLGSLGMVHRFTYAMNFGGPAAAEPEVLPEDDYERLYREYLERYYRETGRAR